MSEDLMDMIDLSAIDLGTDTTPTDLETPEVEETDLETPDVTDTDTDETEGSEGSETPADKEEVPTDGRKVPDAVRKAIKSLKDSGVEGAAAAKVLNETYGREQAYKAEFATVKLAQDAKATIATIDSFGGVAGVQQTLSEVEEIDALLKEGNPAALDKLAEIAGEGLGKLAPEMLNRLQKENPDAWASAIKPHLSSALESVGMPAAVQELWKAIQNSNRADAPQSFKDEAKAQVEEIVKGMYKWMKDLGKADPAAAPAKGDDKLTAREQAIAARETAAFNQEIGQLANPKIDASYNKALDFYFKGQLKSLTPAARNDLKQGIYNEVASLVKADKAYQDQKNVLTTGKARNAAKAAQLMSAKFDTIVNQAAKSVISRRYGKAAPTKAQAQGNGAPAAGAPPAVKGKGTIEKPVLVKELPDRKDVDLSKTTEALMMRGIRILKNGSVIKLA